MRSWRREYRLRFPEKGIEIADLRIAFDIQKDASGQTNKAGVQIYNLADVTRAEISETDIRAELYAGYRESGGPVMMFTGTAIETWSVDQGKDVITELTLSDGQVPLRDTIVSFSYPPGAAGETIVKRAAAEMGVPVVFGEGATLNAWPNGFSYVGMVRGAIAAACYGSGCEWSIQNNVLQIILAGGVVSGRGLVFAPDSGLLKSPERIIRSNFKEDVDSAKFKRHRRSKRARYEKRSGWRIRTLLAPTVQPGDAVKVESRMASGWFRVESIRHTGDTHGGEWASEMELIEGLDGG